MNPVYLVSYEKVDPIFGFNTKLVQEQVPKYITLQAHIVSKLIDDEYRTKVRPRNVLITDRVIGLNIDEGIKSPLVYTICDITQNQTWSLFSPAAIAEIRKEEPFEEGVKEYLSTYDQPHIIVAKTSILEETCSRLEQSLDPQKHEILLAPNVSGYHFP